MWHPIRRARLTTREAEVIRAIGQPQYAAAIE